MKTIATLIFAGFVASILAIVYLTSDILLHEVGGISREGQCLTDLVNRSNPPKLFWFRETGDCYTVVDKACPIMPYKYSGARWRCWPKQS